ncbi:hypothetical protein LCGC14_1416780 [marine sediment metagenome]|uniref:Uncharacterized protein n=1 Tax=marine sediment metagenome TaxID=412755 RepID=A0A0F9KDU5_9ZZZZ
MKHQVYVECGCCGSYHREEYRGDCRNDDEQFIFDELLASGVDNALLIDLEGQMIHNENQTEFVVNGIHIEIVEVDTLGFDIYIDGVDDPINLGDIAYFDKWPTWRDFVPYLAT